MTYYVLTMEGQLVGVTRVNPYSLILPGISIHEFDGIIPDLNSSVWDANSETLVEDTTVLTKLNFLNRFTMSERVTIRASSDPVVKDIMNLLEVADYVDVTDPNTVQGVGYLSAVGLIQSSRIAEILA